MALDTKVLIDENKLVEIGNKVFGTTREPVDIYTMLDNIGPAVDFMTNTEKYGHIYWSAGSSSVVGSLALPEGVTLKDVVFLVGHGGYNNSSVSTRSAYHIPYIYCPAIYNYSPAEGVFDCFGFQLGVYSSTYEGEAWTPRVSPNVYGTSYRLAIYESAGKIYFKYYQGDKLTDYGAYAIAKYGSAVAIYKKR